MESIRVNNLIIWISNYSSHDICLKPIGCRNKLGSRPIKFCCISNFITKLIDDFFTICYYEDVRSNDRYSWSYFITCLHWSCHYRCYFNNIMEDDNSVCYLYIQEASCLVIYWSSCYLNYLFFFYFWLNWAMIVGHVIFSSRFIYILWSINLSCSSLNDIGESYIQITTVSFLYSFAKPLRVWTMTSSSLLSKWPIKVKSFIITFRFSI